MNTRTEQFVDLSEPDFDFGAGFNNSPEAISEQTVDPHEVALRALIAEIENMSDVPTAESLALDALYADERSHDTTGV